MVDHFPCLLGMIRSWQLRQSKRRAIWSATERQIVNTILFQLITTSLFNACLHILDNFIRPLFSNLSSRILTSAETLPWYNGPYDSRPLHLRIPSILRPVINDATNIILNTVSPPC